MTKKNFLKRCGFFIILFLIATLIVACSSAEPTVQEVDSATQAELEAAQAAAAEAQAEAEAAQTEAEAALATAEAKVTEAENANAEELAEAQAAAEEAQAQAEEAQAEAEAAMAEAEAAKEEAATATEETAPTSSDTNPYAPYAGTTLVVSWPATAPFEKAKELIPEFEALSGINVEVDSIQYLNMHDKQVLEMSKPDGGDYDMVAWVVMWKTEYVNKGLIQPLAPFYTDPKLADPNYDPEDLIEAYLLTGGAVGGKRAYLPGPTQALYGLPFAAETSILTYRKDIFEEHNLKVPETYDELLETAQYITDNVDGVYGMTSRGATGHQITAAWLFHLTPYGGGIFDDEWNPIVNNAEGVAAAETLKTIFENSPPGVGSFGIGDAHNTFLQGEVGMFLDHHKIAALTRNPERSRVDGKVGYALHPTAKQCGSETGGFALGIPTNAKNPEAAFLFMQWLTSKEQDRKLAEIGGEPVRKSTLSDPELQAQFPEYEVILEQLECAEPDWRPLVAQWDEMNVNVLGVALSEAMSGEKGVQEALDEAAVKLREIMDREGYYTTAADRYKPYEGTTIVVSWPATAPFEKAKELIPEFEELTGINVEVDSIQYLSMHDKQVLEMSKPDGGDYDMVAWVVMWKTEYVNKGLIQPLAPFFTRADLVDPNYNPEDFVEAYLLTGGAVGGRRAYLPGPTQALYGIPFAAETSILTYRKDIFEEHNLKVPETYDELLETAQYITDNVDGVYGMTSRGATGHQITAAWLFHLTPHGGGVFDDLWNPIVNNPEGVAAAETLKTIFENSPPGVGSFGIGDAHNTFLQGEVGMFLDHHKIAALTRNPERSRVDGLVGYALHPTAKQCGSETGGFALGIPTNAKNPEAAFLFMQWLTSQEQDRKLAEIGGEPVRKSTLNDPELQAQFPEYEVILEQLECAEPDWRPLVAQWDEMNVNVLGVALSEAMSGEKGVQEAMDEAAVKLREIMDREGYYGTWGDAPQ